METEQAGETLTNNIAWEKVVLHQVTCIMTFIKMQHLKHGGQTILTQLLIRQMVELVTTKHKVLLTTKVLQQKQKIHLKEMVILSKVGQQALHLLLVIIKLQTQLTHTQQLEIQLCMLSGRPIDIKQLWI